jgi:hypothetical protein
VYEVVPAAGRGPLGGVPLPGGASQLPGAVTLRLSRALPLGLAEGETARDLAADAECVYAGTDRGGVAQVTWLGQRRGRYDPRGAAAAATAPPLPPRVGVACAAATTGRVATRNDSTATFVVNDTDGEEGEACDASDGDAPSTARATPTSAAAAAAALGATTPPGVARLCLCTYLRLLAVVFDSGAAAVLSSAERGGAIAADALEIDAWLAHSGVANVALAPATRLAAVGFASGTVALHALAEGCRLLRTLSLADWGYSPNDTGAAAQLAWAPDGRALAVGYASRGAAVWSASGCRLVHAMRPQSSGSAGPLPASLHSSRWSMAPGLGAETSPAAEVLDDGVSALAWGPCGYALLLGGEAHATCLVELALARPLVQRRVRVGTWCGAHLMHAADALLLVERDDGEADAAGARGSGGGGGSGGGSGNAHMPEPRGVTHLRLPRAYIADNWPVRHVAVSDDGRYVAAAGRRGVILRSLRSAKWRVFGDVSQERALCAAALLWLGAAVVVVNNAAAVAAGEDDARSGGGGGGEGPAVPPAGSPNVRPSPALASRTGAAYELLVFPRYHLDATSLLARLPLPGPPLAIDALGADFLMVATPPMHITIYAAAWAGALTPTGSPRLSLTPIRELRLLSARAPPITLMLVPPTPARAATPRADSFGFGAVTAAPAAQPPPSSRAAQPLSAVVLRADGELSLLDLKLGSERAVAADVDEFWLPMHGITHGDAARGGEEEEGPVGVPPAALAPPGSNDAPWWVYGHGGMRLIQPDDVQSGAGGGDGDEDDDDDDDVAVLSEASDPELVFDRESYPLGLAPGPGAVVWLTQRLAAAGGGDLPCFEAAPKSQPVLPCLLRHLLRRGADGDAAALASAAEGRPHFTHSLEWLLFSALDAHVSRRGSMSAHAGGLQRSLSIAALDGASMLNMAAAPSLPTVPASSVLARAVALIASFPEFPDVVVSVARKTDEKEWRALFAATGSPSALFEACLDTGRLRTAACYLLIIDKLEGAAAGQDMALRLLQASMDGGAEYPLAGELVRFLVRSGREYALAEEAAAAELPTAMASASLLDAADEDGDAAVPAQRGWLSSLSALAFGAPRASASSAAVAAAAAAAAPASSGLAAAQARARALHARVGEALAAHARELLAARELSRLAALSRGTHFSLPDFFAAERGGPAARLGDFARALNAMHEAVGSLDEPGAREDLEFVLSALQRAGLLDWLVVVATLLQRRSLLRATFARDPELWRAYAAALRSPALRDDDGTFAALLAVLDADLARVVT